MAENEDRTEQATARRRQKAREKGQIAKSRELVSMATMAGSLLVFYLAGAAFVTNISGLTSRLLSLQYGRDSITVLRSASTEMMMILAPFFAMAVIFAVLSNVLQGGFLLKPPTFELERLSPLSGFKNIFSVSALPGVVKSLLKFLVGVVLFFILVKKIITVVPAAAAMDIVDIKSVAFGLMSKSVAYAFATFFVLALADYGYERWKFERSIRMSKEEIKEEFRESEGDPLIKAKIRSLQRDMARRRMMEAVPKATVVITNPTHIAVALLYQKGGNGAPQVIAKGKGHIAATIKEVARKHRIPLVEDKPLARALFKVKLDASIPEDLYRAVAKILAYIYKLRGTAA
ncbi:MAG: flagellar biosynthesis protein FlhB [Nitrospirae bacterium]|nr:flagellar biosynthesis protein FlhB [Nitrospirota bacterium]NTW66570.1 flagellar biosynthesis protein FlhB [Nitrospirota bacterium]